MLVHMTGDAATALLPLGTPPEQIESFREQAGLHRHVIVQYGDYIARATRGDFGTSLRHREPAMALVAERLPATLTLGAAGLAITIGVALPLGLLAAAYKGSWIDRAAGFVALLGQTLPGFWLAVMLILVFGVGLKWFPVSGSDGWRSVVLPAIVVASTPIGGLTRLLRTGLNEVLTTDYIRTAHAKGLAGHVVLLRHGLKNALIPVITLLSVQIGHIFGGAVVAEIVFAYPGMGQLAMQAITNRDITVIQSFVLLQAAVIVAVNVLLDVAYMVLNPKVRYS